MRNNPLCRPWWEDNAFWKNARYGVWILFLGCHLFTTREPEFPDNLIPPELAWRPTTTPLQVVQNFSNSFASLSAIDYLRSFLPEPTTDNLSQSRLRFLAAPETEGVAPAVFANWTIFSEKQFFENFRNQVLFRTPPQFQFTITEQTPITLTEQQWVVVYSLTVLYRNQSELQVFSGSAVLRLLQSDQGFWYIAEWRDFRNSQTQLSLSDLKLRHFN